MMEDHEPSELETAWNEAIDKLAASATLKRLCTKCGATISFLGKIKEEDLTTKYSPETYVCPDCEET